jgi:hypothetical protein
MATVLLAAGVDPALRTALAAGDGEIVVRLESASFRILPEGDGHRIRMDGFECSSAPGTPAIPARRFLVALPPGARVGSVEIVAPRFDEVRGTYRISPTPPLLPPGFEDAVAREREEIIEETARIRASAYASDAFVPLQQVRLVGAGALRAVAYAMLEYTPFRYRPVSGRLELCPAADVRVRYRISSGGSSGEGDDARLLLGPSTDEAAARLFMNYDQVRSLYDFEAPAARERRAVHDYVIVTTSSLIPAINASNFVSWKTALGHSVRLVLTTDSEIAGRPEADLAGRIRGFLREYQAAWGIEYVFLIGTLADVPMRYCWADPTNHSFHPDDPNTYGGETPTDAYYADLSLPDDQSWDLDGDGYPGEYGQDMPDFMPEIAVGRIPTSNATRVTYTLNKLIAFESDTGDWKDRALHGSTILFYENQDGDGYPGIDGARCLAPIRDDLMPGWAVTRTCEHEGLAPSEYPWDPMTESLFTAAWRDGQYGVVNWSGHGACVCASRTVWWTDDGDGIPETDGSDWIQSIPFIQRTSSLEDDASSIVFAISCNVGYPEPNPYGRLGNDLLTKPGFGTAAAVLSATRGAAVGIYWPDPPGGAESICYEFNRFLIDGPAGPRRVGDALLDAKGYCHQNYAYDHYYEYKNLFDYNLYGDPALDRRGVAAVAVAERDAFDEGSTVPSVEGFPNPFAPSTNLRFELVQPGPVTLTIHDTHGRRVRQLIREPLPAGRHDVRWRGLDDFGRPVSSGVYFVRLETNRGAGTNRVILLR